MICLRNLVLVCVPFVSAFVHIAPGWTGGSVKRQSVYRSPFGSVTRSVKNNKNISTDVHLDALVPLYARKLHKATADASATMATVISGLADAHEKSRTSPQSLTLYS